jgi:hypothetical protein
MQIPIFKPQTEWLPPTDFPDLGKYDEIAVDLEKYFTMQCMTSVG